MFGTCMCVDAQRIIVTGCRHTDQLRQLHKLLVGWVSHMEFSWNRLQEWEIIIAINGSQLRPLH